MNKLRIENDYSYLLTDDQALKDKLWRKLRFRQRNYFHKNLYKQRLWDGYVDFFHKTEGRFLTGLLPEVYLALHLLGIEYEIEDKREYISFAVESIDDQFLNQWLSQEMKPVTLE